MLVLVFWTLHHGVNLHIGLYGVDIHPSIASCLEVDCSLWSSTSDFPVKHSSKKSSMVSYRWRRVLPPSSECCWSVYTWQINTALFRQQYNLYQHHQLFSCMNIYMYIWKKIKISENYSDINFCSIRLSHTSCTDHSNCRINVPPIYVEARDRNRSHA